MLLFWAVTQQGTPTPPPAGDSVLMESGDFLLLEDGSEILLE